MFSKTLLAQAKKLSAICREHGIQIATAESCTGGLIASLITELPGSSEVFDRGFITYSNEAKREMLGVAKTLLKQHGAVSAQVAEAMAKGALEHGNANLSMAVTGIAGPGGGTKLKPVGLVYIACAYGKNVIVEASYFKGSRSAIRNAAISAAFEMASEMIAP